MDEKSFLYDRANDANAIFPIFLAVRGICIWQQKSAHAHFHENSAGSNYITMSHQLLVEVRVMAQVKFALISGYSHGKWYKDINSVSFLCYFGNKRENILYSSRIKTRDSAACDASREYVMDRAPWPQPARLRHHQEWFKIVLGLCSLFRFRGPRKRVVKCHKTASNGRLSRSPAVQSKNKESKKGNRIWFKCLEVVTQWLWHSWQPARQNFHAAVRIDTEITHS